MTELPDPISDRNTLTIDDVDELATGFARHSLEARQAGDLLLLFHAFTYEQHQASREGMLQTIKEAFAFIFPAFDAMVSDEIRGALEVLKKGGGGER